MEDVTTIPKDTTLLEATDIVVRNDFVLVKDQDNTVSGIVTASDLARRTLGHLESLYRPKSVHKVY